MARIAFREQAFKLSSMAIIDKANEIIAEYQAKGLKLTLRQLYYQFVARAIIANKQQEYKRLGGIINDGRLAGLIDWDAIEDRTRNLVSPASWSSPASIVDACAWSYKTDLWRRQPRRIEVWIEKEALAGVIADICRPLRVPYFACRGYVSQSEMFDAGYGRLGRYLANGQHVTILHLGDHDPSGIDMTRDITDRLSTFSARFREKGSTLTVDRIALNMSQIDQYAPPPNPAKTTDARFEEYMRLYGTESWEIDALDPDVLRTLITDAVEPLIDRQEWDYLAKTEEIEKRQLQNVSKYFNDVERFLDVIVRKGTDTTDAFLTEHQA